MANELLRDPRLRTVLWRDLIQPGPRQVVHELLLVFPWLIGSLVCAQKATDHPAWLLAALGLSFVFFLTGLRVVHNAYHGALGIPKWSDNVVIGVLSVLMGWPLHAVKVNHLRHHATPAQAASTTARVYSPISAVIAATPSRTAISGRSTSPRRSPTSASRYAPIAVH